MPQMSGKEFVDRARGMGVESKVLYMSGYTENAIVHHGILGEGVKIIMKPFSVAQLTQKVREVLEGN